MRYVPRALLAGGLGFAVSCLAACGGGSGLLSGQQANSLNASSTSSHGRRSARNCGAARQAGQQLADARREPVRDRSTQRCARDLSQGASTVGDAGRHEQLRPDPDARRRTTTDVDDDHLDDQQPTARPRHSTTPTTTTRPPPRRRPPRTPHDRPPVEHLRRHTPSGGGGRRRGRTGNGTGRQRTMTRRPDRRPLPDRGPARRRRHVDRPPRLRPAPRALCRAEAARRAPRRRPDVRVALPPRGAVGGAAGAPQHRPGVRLRLRRPASTSTSS